MRASLFVAAAALSVAAVLAGGARSAQAAVLYDFQIHITGDIDAAFTYLSSDFISSTRTVDAADLASCSFVEFGTSYACKSVDFTVSPGEHRLDLNADGYGFGGPLDFGAFTTPGVHGFGEPLDVVSLTVTDLGAPGVPEPGAWALMIAGFGLIGAQLRRRERAFA